MTVNLNINGTAYEIPIWKRRPDQNPNGPIASGRVELAKDQPAEARQPHEAAPQLDDVDLPF